VKPHAIDPFSFVFGLMFALMGWFFLTGDRSVADIGSTWIWPVTILMLGLLMVLYAAKRILSSMARSPHQEQMAELEPEDESKAPD
jgi:cytochrome c-type biogenesis protein CcmH/NrfF